MYTDKEVREAYLEVTGSKPRRSELATNGFDQYWQQTFESIEELRSALRCEAVTRG